MFRQSLNNYHLSRSNAAETSNFSVSQNRSTVPPESSQDISMDDNAAAESSNGIIPLQNGSSLFQFITIQHRHHREGHSVQHGLAIPNHFPASMHFPLLTSDGSTVSIQTTTDRRLYDRFRALLELRSQAIDMEQVIQGGGQTNFDLPAELVPDEMQESILRNEHLSSQALLVSCRVSNLNCLFTSRLN